MGVAKVVNNWASEASPTLGYCSIEISGDIRECGSIGECSSTLYVGLSGIARNLIQKSTGCGHTLLSIFFSS